MTSDLTDVQIGGQTMKISSMSPFLGQGFCIFFEAFFFEMSFKTVEWLVDETVDLLVEGCIWRLTFFIWEAFKASTSKLALLMTFLQPGRLHSLVFPCMAGRLVHPCTGKIRIPSNLKCPVTTVWRIRPMAANVEKLTDAFVLQTQHPKHFLHSVECISIESVCFELLFPECHIARWSVHGDVGLQVKAWYNAVSLQFWHPDVQVQRAKHGCNSHGDVWTYSANAAVISSVSHYDLAVDGRNPAPVDMVDIPLFTGFYNTSQVVRDFFHQQYHTLYFTSHDFFLIRVFWRRLPSRLVPDHGDQDCLYTLWMKSSPRFQDVTLPEINSKSTCKWMLGIFTSLLLRNPIFRCELLVSGFFKAKISKRQRSLVGQQPDLCISCLDGSSLGSTNLAGWLLPEWAMKNGPMVYRGLYILLKDYSKAL